MSVSLPSHAQGERRFPRVRYSVPVRVTGDFSDREPVFISLVGSLLDLGEGGMSMETPLELRIGSTIACSVRLGGRQAYFLGRVIWRHESRTRPGKRVGVKFEAPDDADAGLVRHVVALGAHYTQRVYLRFEGRTDTIGSLARTHDRGLLLSAPLSILQQQTKVRFGFAADGPYFAGAVESTNVGQEQGLLTLQVKIDVAKEEARAFGEAVRTRARLQDPEAHTPAGVELASRASEPERTGARWRVMRSSAAVAAASLAAGALTALLMWRIALPDAALESRGEQTQPRSPGIAAAAFAAAPELPSARMPHTPEQATPTHAAVVSSAPTVALLEPSYKWRSYKREVRIPIQGGGAGLRHSRLTEPPGVAIELPHAAPRVTRSRYAVGHAGVLRLDVGTTRRGGTRIRLWLEQPVGAYAVVVSADAVTIRLPGR